MKVIDLFCGAGGFSKGFEMAGFEIILGVDNWQVACDNFKLNFPKSEVLNNNISDINISDLPKADVIIGGTPCQEFTSLNLKKQPYRGMINVCHFLKIVYKYKPKYWIMENVIGLNKYLPPYLHRVKLRCNFYGCDSGRMRLFVGDFTVPAPRNINYNPSKTFVAVDNRNKNKANRTLNYPDLDSMKFEGTEKEVRQLKANCVIPKLAFAIAKEIKKGEKR